MRDLKNLVNNIWNPLILLLILGGTALMFLPESPFQNVINFTLQWDEARYWGWILPIREYAVLFEAVATAYYLYAIIYALLKFMNVVK